jgi:hypothetical protein
MTGTLRAVATKKGKSWLGPSKPPDPRRTGARRRSTIRADGGLSFVAGDARFGPCRRAPPDPVRFLRWRVIAGVDDGDPTNHELFEGLTIRSRGPQPSRFGTRDRAGSRRP